MSLEGLRTQVDALDWEKSQLEAESCNLSEFEHVEVSVLERERDSKLKLKSCLKEPKKFQSWR